MSELRAPSAPGEAPPAALRNIVSLVLVLAGASVLALGVFVPLVSAPYVGAVTFLTSGDSPRILMFAAAIAALVLTLVGWTRNALWAGILAIAVIGYGYWRLQDKIGELQNRFGDGLVGGVVRRGMNLIELEWGWAVIVVGAMLIVIGGALAWRWPPRPLPPVAKRVMVVIGAVLVAMGVFLPLIHVPRIAMTSDMLGSDAPRVVMFVAAMAALGLTLIDWTRHALWPGLAGAAALGVGYYQVLANIQREQANIRDVDSRFGDGWMGKLAEKAVDALERRYGEELLGKAANMATELVQLQWGWAVLAIGTVMILTGSGLAWGRGIAHRPPMAGPPPQPPQAAPVHGSGEVSQVPGGEPRP